MTKWPLLALALVLACAAASRAAAAAPFCDGLIGAVRAQAGDAGAVFIRSYAPGDFEAALPAVLASTAFVYDNAVAAIALVACDDLPDALRIGRALSRASRSDRTFHDGRIRNAYRAGPVGGDAPPLLPGWWDAQANRWAEDWAQDGTATGNVAWAALALLTLHQASGDTSLRDDAARLIDWVAATTSCDNGFCGGVQGYDPEQTRVPWISTEHNVDVAAAATWLARLPDGARFAPIAAQARRQLGHAFQTDHFLIGTKPDGSPGDTTEIVLDVQLWPWMALADAPADWRRALGFAGQHLAVDNGFDFNGDRDGVWVEGTAQAALAYRIDGDAARSAELVAGLGADLTATGLLNATRSERVSTGLAVSPASKTADFFYRRRPHLGATAWAVLAARGWNPFTGARVQ